MMIKKILFATLIACSFYVYAADTTTTNVAPTDDAVSQGVPGAYNDVRVTDKDVQAVAKFAVAQMQQGSLVKILAAQVQVVAGKNYSLQLLLAQNGVNYQYNVVVFVPLPADNQPMQLTTVQALGEIDS